MLFIIGQNDKPLYNQDLGILRKQGQKQEKGGSGQKSYYESFAHLVAHSSIDLIDSKK
jgi:hypothetical protein